MKNSKLLKSSIGGILVCFMTLSSMFSAFAYDNPPPDAKSKSNITESIKDQKGHMKEAVDKLVEEGRLTKDKAAKILEYKEKRLQELKNMPAQERQQVKRHCKKGGLLKDMEEKGIITAEEAKAIREKLCEMREARRTEALNGLVSKGVLSRDDVKNIESYLIKARVEKKAQYQRLRDMSDSERKEYLKSIKNQRKDIISRMVEDKVITEKQAEEIRKVLPELEGYRHKKLH